MIQKHLLLLALPDPGLAAKIEGPPDSKAGESFGLWMRGPNPLIPWHLPADVPLQTWDKSVLPSMQEDHISLLTREALVGKQAVPNPTEAPQNSNSSTLPQSRGCPAVQGDKEPQFLDFI